MLDLILASGSKARQEMLSNAGYNFDVMPADIDEEKIIKDNLEKLHIKKMALSLASAKAQLVSQNNLNSFIIGSDQILSMNGRLYSKAKNIEEAKLRLREFQGKSHKLYSAVSLYKDNKEIFSYCDKATLIMRSLSDKDIDNYCEKAGDVLTLCVGCYALESHGVRLFERIVGDYFTILGMPLLPLVGVLNKEGFTL
jgi:septum formation protein